MLVLCEGAKPGGLVPDVDGALTDFSKEVGAPVGVGPRDAVDAFDVMCDADVLVGAARIVASGVAATTPRPGTRISSAAGRVSRYCPDAG